MTTRKATCYQVPHNDTNSNWRRLDGTCSNKKPPKKKLQASVITGWGEKQELVVVESTVSPPSPPIFRIKDVDKEVVITQMKLIPTIIYNSPLNNETPWYFWGKVIINGYVDKNVNYKTITDYTPYDVNGPVYHFTTRAHFSTFIEVRSDEPILETDRVELLSAIVEGEKEDLLDPNPVPEGAPSWAVTYNRLLEKILVRIEVKTVRTEDVTVQPDC